ncbi:CPBP family intramembrane glutamic endopeptidase [Limnoglobus roseus]|uniref:CPBP family intramembrane metalloprotease n=1 Tax=Limnoglobus roseus TaxID=2598579 RepID=A0A5C1A9G8_9BACT|nr:CPBP family intramembrane glutamic endopeptidase [Limnoglobus roseus]QEL14696.1 CPBP family intramembrane metalloprotease [Limnoglobus roseus]
MTDLRAEAVAMATAAACVAAAAVPAGAACWWLARRCREPVVPRYRKGFSRWDGFDALVLFCVCTMLSTALAGVLDSAGYFRPIFNDVRPGADAAEAVRFDYQNRRNTIAGLIVMPGVMAGFAWWKRFGWKELDRERVRRFIADVSAGVGGWCVLMPLTLVVHFVVNAISQQLDVTPDEHPLKSVKLQTAFDVALFLAGACVVAPFFEEMAFRRVLIPWAARRLYRPWILMAFAALMAYSRGGGHSLVGPLAFVGAAALALFALERVARRSLRPAAAILATATFFAAIHASVWPTPIPLLMLGVGLGWIVLRTKSVTAAVVTHGLFNAVSAVFLLRG